MKVQPRYGYAIALLCLCALTACGLSAVQQDASRRFARSSARVGDLTAAELARMRRATIEMNMLSMALGGKVDPTNLDMAFSPKDVTPRVTAARALSNYGKVLLSLVEASEEARLKEASDGFVSSFQSAAGELGGFQLSEQEVEALGEVVQAVGGLIVEHKRAKAVKEIATATQPDVDRICDLLILDFTPDAGGLAQNLGATISKLNVYADRKIESDAHGERASAARARTLVGEERARLETFAVQIVAILGQLKSANQELLQVLAEKPSLAQIQQLGVQINGLADAAQVLAGN